MCDLCAHPCVCRFCVHDVCVCVCVCHRCLMPLKRRYVFCRPSRRVCLQTAVWWAQGASQWGECSDTYAHTHTHTVQLHAHMTVVRVPTSGPQDAVSDRHAAIHRRTCPSRSPWPWLAHVCLPACVCVCVCTAGTWLTAPPQIICLRGSMCRYPTHGRYTVTLEHRSMTVLGCLTL